MKRNSKNWAEEAIEAYLAKSKVPPSVPKLPISGKGLWEQIQDVRKEKQPTKSEYDRCVEFLEGKADSIEVPAEEVTEDFDDYKRAYSPLTEEMVKKFLQDVASSRKI